MALVAVVMDCLSRGSHVEKLGHAAVGFMVAVVKTMGQVKSLAARLVVWAYGLMILIAIATYTGLSP